MIYLILLFTLYIIYYNQSIIAYNFLKLQVYLESFFVNVKYQVYYLVLNENNTLSKCSKLQNDKQAIITYLYKNKTLRTLKNQNINVSKIHLNDNMLMNEYLNYESKIISCLINIKKGNDYICNEVDVFNLINQFIIYDSILALSNNLKSKNLLLAFFKQNIEELNSLENNEFENYTIEWIFMLDDTSLYQGEHIVINVNKGKFCINVTT